MSSPTAILYPNGQQLLSSALTPKTINSFILQLTCGMLGINPPDYSQVRDSWQTQGQPFADVGTDVCFVACVPENVDYRLVRNRTYTTVPAQPGVEEQVQENWTYTKGWRVDWVLYGPNAEDRARMLKTALFLDWVNDELNNTNLFPLPDTPEVTRIPELVNAQWFERADFHCVMYENVTETIMDGTVQSVEIKLFDASPDDPVADFTVVNPTPNV
jgi:hypothetical protein